MMKKTVLFLMIIALAVGNTGTAFAQKKEKKQDKEVTALFTLNEEICQNCKRKIEGFIPFEKGVTALAYNEDGTTVEVTYRTDRTDTLKLQKAFDKIKLEVLETRLKEATR